jgi:transposase
MARRSFTVIDITEILTHWHAGRSLNEIHESLGVDRKTISKYVAPAVRAGIAPGSPALSQVQWGALVRDWFPELVDTTLRQVTWPEIGVHHEYIVEQLKEGVTKATIHQRLRDDRGLRASLASLKRYIAANMSEEERRDKVVVLRGDVTPGDEAQIDYGRLGMWLDPESGRRRTVWAFVMVLACSRHLFVWPTLVMDQRAWTEAHVAAFEFFGGLVRRLVPDNLRTGVTKPDLYDPKINRSYAELAEHYGVLVDPARARRPRDKARVERPMPYVRDSYWRGRETTFTSVKDMRVDAVRWCLQVAGQRQCRPLDGAQPLAVFTAVEAPTLRPLPVRVFELASWSSPKARTFMSRWVELCIACRGDSSASVSMPARPGTWSRSSIRASWSPPTAASTAAGARTTRTIRRRRSRSRCAPRCGAARGRHRSVRTWQLSSPTCWP